MKHLVGIGFLIITLCALNAAISCSFTGKNSSSSTSGIAAPTVKANGEVINVTSAPIKDESFLDSIQYANIFRNVKDTTTWTNIGQVSCAQSGSSFTAFNFIDYYVDPTLTYCYRIRYYDGEKYYYSSASVYTANTNGIGEQTLMPETDITAYYYGNDKTGEYTMEVTVPDPIEGIHTDFLKDDSDLYDGLYMVISNGSSAKPFALATASTLTAYTDTDGNALLQIAASDTLTELHKILPNSFLDVKLTTTGLALVRHDTDDGDDDTNTLNIFYWTPVREVTMTSQYLNESGDYITGTATTVATITTYVVPSVPDPTNPFDATSLSRSARTAHTSARTATTSSAVQLLDFTSF